MADIKFNYDIFYNWYDKSFNDSTIFTNDINIDYFKFDTNGQLSRRLNAFKAFNFLTLKYSLYLNNLSKNSSHNRIPKIYINKMTTSKWLLFVFPRIDSSGRIWGDHYSFVRNLNDPSTIAFHRTDIVPNVSNQRYGRSDHTDCYFQDNLDIKYINNSYDVNSIVCEKYTNLIKLKDVFPIETELNLIADLILYPWISNLHTEYLQIGGNKNIKKDKFIEEEIEVIAIEDKPNHWWYTIIWKIDTEYKTFIMSSEELPGKDNIDKLTNMILNIKKNKK
jgi:hypothetical protein